MQLGDVVAHLFISYATPDRAIAEEVATWLRDGGHEPFLAHDLREGIGVGEAWKQRLYAELRRVDAVIGVVTRSFLASEWCFAEVGIADSRGCRLMPLRAEANVVHPLMQELQDTDYHADPQHARDRVLQALRLLEGGEDPWREGDNPFPGLEPFTAARSRVFFGRLAEAREVSHRLRALGSTRGVLALVGPSGCGKSSLLHAGVIPVLAGDPAWLVVASLVPGRDPVPELARVLAITAHRLGLDWSASDVRSRLNAGPEGLRCVADDLLARNPGTQARWLLVVVDQAEELVTRTTPTAQQQFTQLLREAVAGAVRVVVAMRSEFLDDLRNLPTLAGVPIEASVLAPLEREALREVVEQPAQVARLRLDPGLATRLVADTGGGEALPLLAFILHQLAEGLPAGGTVSLSHYHDLGGVHGALTQHADAALAEAVRVSGLTEREVLAGLTHLVTVDENGRRARRRITLTSLPTPLRDALGVFVEHRLLLRDTTEGRVWLAMAHEALLTWWPPLNTATAEIIAALRAARAVEQAATEWINSGRAEYFLWGDQRLTATLATLGMTSDDSRDPAASSTIELDDQAREFLKATTQRVTATKERERHHRTRIIAVLSTLLLLTTAASILAFQQRSTAQTQRDTAIFNQITAQADRLRSTDVSLAAQLDLTAYRMHPTPDLRTTLITLDNATLSTPLTGHINWVVAAVFSPDGHTLATGSGDHTVRLWNVTDPTHPTALGSPLTGHTNYVNAVAFSPDGHTLATASDDHTARLWKIPYTLVTGHTNWVFAVAFSPDGHTLATGSGDHTVRLWNVRDPTHPTALGSPLTGHTNSVFAVAFSPDGHTLATGSADQTVRLWNVTDPTHPTALGSPLTGHTNWVTSVAFSPDGHTLATASYDQTVRLWNVTDPTHPSALGSPLTGHTTYVASVAFSPDGHTLATASYDHTVRLWNVTDPTHPTALGPPLTGHTDSVFAVAFSPDGHTLATASYDQTVRLWNVTDPTHPTALGSPLTGHTDRVTSVAFSPDGHTLATASLDHTVRLWEMNVDHAIQRICATTTNTLTPTTWNQYVSPDLPYHPPCP
ncbi:MAG: TIR domain-containing protein [Pseudonocardiales bacterium]|nr:TIR domain-containing protein [Pseudonocardiales bacterium]